MTLAKPRVGFVDVVLGGIGLAAIFVAVTTWVRAQPGSDLADQWSLVGAELPTLAVHGSGGPGTLPDSSEATLSLAFVFRSSCPVCERNVEAWRTLGRALDGSVDVLALSPESPEAATAWIRRNELRVRGTYSVDDPIQLATRWDLPAVPLTMVLRGRRVVWAHRGVLSDDDLDEIPGLLEGSPTCLTERS